MGRRLLDQGWGICFIATDRLDLGNALLVMEPTAVSTKAIKISTTYSNLRFHPEP